VITVYELIRGAAKSGRTTEELAKISRFIEGGPQSTPFEWADAEAAGHLRAALARRGEMIGAYDILIAGQALARGWIVVTANSDEFARVEGLQLENWQV
jgi:tRNA(fMet)-specific endonuclease VapC